MSTKGYYKVNQVAKGKQKKQKNYKEDLSETASGLPSSWNGNKDHVRHIVEQEGRTARNLITWSVPVDEQKNQSPIHNSEAQTQTRNRGRNQSRAKQRKRYHHSNQQDQQEYGNTKLQEQSRRDRQTKSCEYQNHLQKIVDNKENEFDQPRSAQGNKKDSLRARYWSYLFENLQRAVDEIYETCDNDESIVECQEVIMMLDNCKKDFVALISRIDMFNELEKQDAKDRPQSLAWEVRKMSPGKCLSPTTGLMLSGRRSSSPAQRCLAFEPSSTSSVSTTTSTTLFTTAATSQSSVVSWADKVKGVKKFAEPVHVNVDESSTNNPLSNVCNDETLKRVFPSPIKEAEDEVIDDVGWEVVSRGRHRSRGSSSSISLKNTSSVNSMDDGTVHKNHEKFGDAGNNTRAVAVSNAQEAMASPLAVTGASEADGTSPVRSSSLEDSAEKLLALGVEYSEESNGVGLTSNDSWTVLAAKASVSSLADIEKQASFEELMLEADIDYSIEQQEEDLRNQQIEEENKKALASAIEEEEHLTKELEDEALKNMEEDDDVEDLSSDKDGKTADCDEDGEDEDDYNQSSSRDDTSLDVSLPYEDNSTRKLSWDEILAQYDREQTEREDGMGWGELSEMEPKRPPGRALEMHQKLSSPSRTRPRAESVRISEERMLRAERKRLKLLESKCQILKSLSERVRSVRQRKNIILSEQEKIYKDKMKRVEQKRQLVLQEKIKKAQEEESKVNEIAFINSLEAQNKKIEVQEKHQTNEARLQEIMEERQRKRDEQQAREEAAQERRKCMEAIRKARLEEILLKRQEQETKREKEKLEKEKAREEAIRERQRDREMKVAARNEALQQATEELQKKIEQKQLESSRRHEERIGLVKEKAASSSRHTTVEEAPSIIPYEKKKQCTLCSIEIVSELFLVSHLKGKKHKEAVKDVNRKISEVEIEGFSMKYIKEIDDVSSVKENDKEQYQKAIKKRLKKIKSRMNQKGREYEAVSSGEEKLEDSQKRARLQRSLKDINKLLQAQGSTFWPTNKVTALDRALGEIGRLLQDKNYKDQRTLCQIGGLAVLTRVLLLLDVSGDKKSNKPMISDKALVHASHVIKLACDGNADNCLYMLFSNKLSTLIDLLNYRLDIPPVDSGNKENDQALDSIRTTSNDQLITSILDALISLIRLLRIDANANRGKNANDAMQRVHDLVSYVVCSGMLEKYHQLFQNIQEPPEDTPILELNNKAILMLHGLVLSLVRVDGIFSNKKDDPTLLIQLLKRTQLIGLLSLMYAVLHQSGTARISPSPFPLSEMIVNILTAVLRLINLVALLDLNSLQSILAAEGNSLQLRSVANYLLRYCSTQNCDELLFELVITIGYFTVMHKDNQIFIQTGRAPTILQQLGLLPFQYFSDPKLRMILLPTLISCCYGSSENKMALEQEISQTLLASFIEENLKDEKKTEKCTAASMDFVIDESIASRASFELRFPKSKWQDALEYFSEEKISDGST
eukprot:gene10037-11063_t